MKPTPTHMSHPSHRILRLYKHKPSPQACSPSRRHRHFVALPVFLALLLGPTSVEWFRFELGNLQAAVQTLPEGQRLLQTEAGVQYILEPGAQLSDEDDLSPSLRHGSVLVRSDGLATLRAGGLRTQGLRGAYHVSWYGQDVVVAAITSPVYVTDGVQAFLVPVGRQWRGALPLPQTRLGAAAWFEAREVKAVPKRFVREQLRILSVTPVATSTALDDTAHLASLVPTAVLLPAAEKRAQQAGQDATIAAVEQAMRDRAVPAMHEHLEQVTINPRNQQLIAALLPQAANDATVATPLLQWLAQTEALWLLTSVHPDYSAVAWTLTEPTLSLQGQLLAHFLLPKTDLQPQAHGSLVVDRWSQQFADLLASHPAPQSFIDRVLPRLARTIRYMDAQGYPERARLYANATLRALSPYEANLSVASQALLTEFLTFDYAAALRI